MERAAEPSDYIWENMGITPIDRIKNAFIVFVILSLVLGLAYYFQFRM
jgi:hypothetical protein